MSSKSSKNRERRELVEKMRREARAAERRRTTVVVVMCVVLALIIVGAAGYTLYKNRQKSDALQGVQLANIGVDASAAGCTNIVEKVATGQGVHTTNPVTYPQTPPSYGPHNPAPAPGGLHFFDTADRPPVEVLVHNLEHGWTIVWYDDTVTRGTPSFDAIQEAARKFATYGNDPQYNVFFAPWTSKDQGGGVIPDGKHIAITHWSVHMGPTYDPSVFANTSGESKTIQSWGESEYCSKFSGAVLSDFMGKFPYDDAPEGFLWHE